MSEADRIRDWANHLAKEADPQWGTVQMLGEIAAQLAELNELMYSIRGTTSESGHMVKIWVEGDALSMHRKPE